MQRNTDGTRRDNARVEGQGFELLENPEHLVAIVRNRSKTSAKLQSSLGSKDLGKNDREAQDEGTICAKLARHLVGTRKLTLSQIRSSRVQRHRENSG